MSWIPYQRLIMTPDIGVIKIDTRDFHVLSFPSDLAPNITTGGEKNMIQEKDVLEWIRGLEDISGGPKSWRLLRFRSIRDGAWLKYLTLYRKEDGRFLVTSGDNPVPILEMTKENIILQWWKNNEE